MTLLEIEILKHYHCSSGDYREGDYSAPAVREAINRFRDELELLRPITNATTTCYEITERGTAYIMAIQRVPLPVKAWIVPGVSQ